ncbi:hypothetical protein AB0K00_27855 [Dactylosporangium sp. NPDC049525]|uniref:hypothetical protein n=1 Tax=Dactylosporangium sp. NPDC049525 TaxID=3154730 RepID=UPI003416679B
MARLVRIPLVLAFAVAWTAGSYALGFAVLADRWDVAVGAAFIGGILAAAGLGTLTSRGLPILLGIPLAIGAMTTSVYLAGAHHVEDRPRLRVVVTTAGTLQDPSGRPLPYRLDEPGQARGPADVYVRDPGSAALWPAAVLGPRHRIEAAATVLVPAFAGYVVLLGVAGAASSLAYRRRFERHMST